MHTCFHCIIISDLWLKKWNKAKYGPKKADNKNELWILPEFSSECVAVLRVVLVYYIRILPGVKTKKKNIQFPSGIVGSRKKNFDNDNGTRKLCHQSNNNSIIISNLNVKMFINIIPFFFVIPSPDSERMWNVYIRMMG